MATMVILIASLQPIAFLPVPAAQHPALLHSTTWHHARTQMPNHPCMALKGDLSEAAADMEEANRIWAEVWWPLAFSDHTSREEPVPVQLLGADLVLWWDRASSRWRCTLDRCSHRLAPLSEGRIADDGCIECPYHGWRFEGELGQCTHIPQQPSDAAAKGGGSSKSQQERATVLALPTREAQGLIWVWAGSLFDGAAAPPLAAEAGDNDDALAPFLIDALERPGVEHSDYSRELHMDCSTLCENVMDPAHLPFTHHKTISKREKAQPIPFSGLSLLEPSGFSADRPTAGWPGKVTFRAPHLVLAETHRSGDVASGSVGAGSGAFSDWNVVYAVPTAPGRCRLLVRVVFEVAKMKPPLKW